MRSALACRAGSTSATTKLLPLKRSGIRSLTSRSQSLRHPSLRKMRSKTTSRRSRPCLTSWRTQGVCRVRLSPLVDRTSRNPFRARIASRRTRRPQKMHKMLRTRSIRRNANTVTTSSGNWMISMTLTISSPRWTSEQVVDSEIYARAGASRPLCATLTTFLSHSLELRSNKKDPVSQVVTRRGLRDEPIFSATATVGLAVDCFMVVPSHDHCTFPTHLLFLSRNCF